MPSLHQLNSLRSFYQTGATKSIVFRKRQLKKLKAAIEQHETALYTALHTDLKKSPEECWVTENGFVLAEINNAINKLEGWMQPEDVSTNLVNLPSRSFVL